MANPKKKIVAFLLVGAVAASSLMAADVPAMSFFITSEGLGKGGDLGALAGADAHCTALAKAAGSDKTWAAYLSTQGPGAINAKDRIGTGPWYNAKGNLIAKNVSDLHLSNRINHETGLDEKGNSVPYVTWDAQGKMLPVEQQTHVEHSIMTGTQADGTAFPPGADRTCKNWTSSAEGSAGYGHFDRRSPTPGVSPWSAVSTTKGCSQKDLGAHNTGRLYCFAK